MNSSAIGATTRPRRDAFSTNRGTPVADLSSLTSSPSVKSLPIFLRLSCNDLTCDSQKSTSDLLRDESRISIACRISFRICCLASDSSCIRLVFEVPLLVATAMPWRIDTLDEERDLIDAMESSSGNSVDPEKVT